MLDPNTATEQELQSINGIGPVCAKRIRAGCPYGTIDDLLHVEEIGPVKLEAMRPYFKIIKKKESKRQHAKASVKNTPKLPSFSAE